jgi:hypothetical protein
MSTTQVKYQSTDPSTSFRNLLTVDTDTDLSEVWLDVNGAGVCIDGQQAAQIVRQLSGWLGDRAARA